MRVEQSEWVLDWAYSEDGKLKGGKCKAILTVYNVDTGITNIFYDDMAIDIYCLITAEVRSKYK